LTHTVLLANCDAFIYPESVHTQADRRIQYCLYHVHVRVTRTREARVHDCTAFHGRRQGYQLATPIK
jgi:hypothetical protein